MTSSSERFKIYSASAGSGKTFTLTAEYLRFALANPNYNYKRILAITFTNKATKEMKSRILEACRDFTLYPDIPSDSMSLWNHVLRSVDITPEELSKRSTVLFSNILHNYSDFAISTIDSFSQRILRSFAYELKIPINFEVKLDNQETLKIISNRLIAQVGQEENVTRLLERITFNSLNDFDRFDIRKDLFDSAKTMVRDESYDYVKALSEIPISKILNIGDKLSQKVSELVKILEDKAKKSLSLILDIGIDLNEYSGKYPFHSIYRKILDKNLNLSLKTFQKVIKSDATYFPKTKKYFEEEVEHIKPQISEWGLEIMSTYEQYQIFNAVYKNFAQIAVIALLHKLYKDYQKEEDIVLISEFNQLISKHVKLQPAPFIYEKLGEQYDYFLIDEFQDTSVMQFQNILPLLTNSISNDTTSESLIVGDSKQAIYRWRGGETAQLNILPDLIGSASDPILQEHQAILHQHAIHKNLEENYRSKEHIVNFNNDLYNMVSQRADLASCHDIYQNAHQNVTKKDSGGYVQIKLFDYVSNNTKQVVKEEIKLARISSTLETIKEAKARGYRYKDIAILARNRKELSWIGDALTNLGINTISAESLLLSKDTSVSLFPAFYSHYLRPDDEIIQLVIATKLFYLGLLPVPLEEINTTVKSTQDFTALIKSWNPKIDINKLYELSILEAWELYASWLNTKNAAIAYHAYFRQYIYDFTLKYGDDLDHFVLWWEDERHKLSIDSAESVDGINLLTIHKSKGLQYEIVILPFANWKVEKSEKEWIEVDIEELKPIEAYYANISKTLGEVDGFKSGYQKKMEKVTLDNLNLLYVATTRAVSELYIFSQDVKKEYQGKDAPLSNMSTISEYIHNYLLHQKTDGSVFEIGHVTHPKKQTETKSDNLIQHISYESGRSAHISIKQRSSTIWDDEITEKIALGKTLHAMLEEIKKPDDIERVTLQAISYGWIESSLYQFMIDSLTTIVNHERLHPYFNDRNDVKSEISILTPDGKVYIPDRFIIDDNGVSIIDFKSGARKSKYHDQLRKYGSLIMEMGYDIHEMMVVYLDPLEIENVV